MKKFNLSLVAVLTMSTFVIAGGDIAPVEPIVETPMVEESKGAFYVGLGYGALEGEIDPDNSWTRESDTYDELLLLAGYKFNKYVAVEGRYWFGDENTLDFYRDGVLVGTQDVSVDSWGLYVKPMYPVTDAFNVYALLGYGGVSLDYGYDDTDFDDNDGLSWGVGVDYSINEKFAVFVDYVSLYDDDNDLGTYGNADVTVDTVNVGVTYKF